MRLGLFLLLMGGAACAQAASASEEGQRAARLEARLLAPCCWSETLAAHKSFLAGELRAEIDRDIASGKSDADIEASLKRRYGQRILLEPEGVAGVILNVVPAALLVAGTIWVGLLIRRWTRRAGKVAPA